MADTTETTRQHPHVRITRLMALVDLLKDMNEELNDCDGTTPPDRQSTAADRVYALAHAMDAELQAMYGEVDHG